MIDYSDEEEGERETCGRKERVRGDTGGAKYYSVR